MSQQGDAAQVSPAKNFGLALVGLSKNMMSSSPKL